jgi:hypothetical protein
MLLGTLVVLPAWLWEHIGPPAALIPWLLACDWVVEVRKVGTRYCRYMLTGSTEGS